MERKIWIVGGVGAGVAKGTCMNNGWEEGMQTWFLDRVIWNSWIAVHCIISNFGTSIVHIRPNKVACPQESCTRPRDNQTSFLLLLPTLIPGQKAGDDPACCFCPYLLPSDLPHCLSPHSKAFPVGIIRPSTSSITGIVSLPSVSS